jgi:hypothetical protein
VAFPRIVPIAPVRVRQAFDGRDWIFEPKLDGFRTLAYVADGNCTLVSRRRHEYKAFAPVAAAIATALGNHQAIVDGEIVCLNKAGEPQFNALLFRRALPWFDAFDLLWLDSECFTLPREFITLHHRPSQSGWERVLTKGFDVSPFKNEKGFEHIAKDPDMPYPSRSRRLLDSLQRPVADARTNSHG